MYRRVWVVVLVGIFLITPATAQTTATISGSVRDGTGALIPGASVMAKNVETGITRTAMSDEQGRYQLLNLNVGRYEIEVSLSGFQTAVRSGIVLALGDQTVVNFTFASRAGSRKGRSDCASAARGHNDLFGRRNHRNVADCELAAQWAQL